MFVGSADEPEASVAAPSGLVNQIRDSFRANEDYTIAHELQKKEFDEHFHMNRSERKQVGGDVKLSKYEQELEDTYSKEYWAQVRLDREKEDEKMARQLEREEEERRRAELLSLELKDLEIAKRYQLEEESGKKQLGREMKTRSGVAPACLTPEQWERMVAARRDGRPVPLPSGLSPEHRAAIQKALKEEDKLIAREAHDSRLARYLQGKELAKTKVDKEHIDNELNEAVAGRPESAGSSNKDLIDLSGDDKPPRPPPPKCASKKSQEGNQSSGSPLHPKDLVAMGAVRVLPSSNSSSDC